MEKQKTVRKNRNNMERKGQKKLRHPSGSFVTQLKEIGVNPEEVIDYLREELIALAKEKKKAGFSYQDFHNMIFESGFECTYIYNPQ